MSEWVKWKGGSCPVGLDTVVDVIFLSGDTDQDRAGDYNWWNLYAVDPANIVLYRVVSAQDGETHKQPTPTPQVYDKVLGFLCDLCHPEQFGHAVTKEVRQRARQLAEELEGATKS